MKACCCHMERFGVGPLWRVKSESMKRGARMAGLWSEDIVNTCFHYLQGNLTTHVSNCHPTLCDHENLNVLIDDDKLVAMFYRGPVPCC